MTGLNVIFFLKFEYIYDTLFVCCRFRSSFTVSFKTINDKRLTKNDLMRFIFTDVRGYSFAFVRLIHL